MDPQSDHIELDYKEFVEQPEYFVGKFPHQFLLLKEGKKLKCVVLSAFLFNHITDKLNIDWSKK
jgi:hypothetical protein